MAAVRRVEAITRLFAKINPSQKGVLDEAA
jgi:hypothetical protein